jgi:uncharacterized protein (TIGR02284 family)
VLGVLLKKNWRNTFRRNNLVDIAVCCKQLKKMTNLFLIVPVAFIHRNYKNNNMKTTTATAEVLNDLVQINNDRIEGYEKARQELKDGDADLKTLFLNMIAESQKYKLALATEVAALGEDIETGTTNSGKIYRAWMDVKAVFTGHDRKTVLNNCEFGEDAAQNGYKMALEEEELPSNIRELISDQKASLRRSHDEIKRLRDAQA